jgi:hypothetical protein
MKRLFREKKAGQTYIDVPTSGHWKYTVAETNPDTNAWEDVTSMENWIYYFGRANRIEIQYDYLWLQRRINDVFMSKAGADNTTRWGNCTNAEKDHIIYYNQMKASAEATEDTDKVTHLIVTGQAADASEAAAFLKKSHAESIVRARPGIIQRVDGAKLIETIITYLNRADTTQLLNTVQTHMIRYKEFAMVGTIIYGEEEGLRDYIESTGPTYGAPNGLVEEGWTTINPPATLTDLRDELINILFEDND